MSSKRRLRRKEERRGCMNKTKHATQAAAEQHVQHILRTWRKDAMKMRATYMSAYLCKFCGSWHVGGRKGGNSMPIFIDKLTKAGILGK